MVNYKSKMTDGGGYKRRSAGRKIYQNNLLLLVGTKQQWQDLPAQAVFPLFGPIKSLKDFDGKFNSSRMTVRASHI
jgi:hypothetical protein